MHVWTRWLLAFALVMLPGCGNDSTTGPTEPTEFADDRPTTLLRLAFAQQKWQAAGLRDYRYQYRQSCFCAPPATAPVLVRVRAGAVVDAVYAETGLPVPDALHLPTIDGLFARLHEAADAKAVEIRAEYDPGFGFPTQVYIDSSRQIADEEISYQATALTPLS